jgi:creatinine amidohydrolase
MRFEDYNWMDIEQYLAADDRLILVVGACEQHGFLSLLSDVRIPLALADAASLQTGVLIAPSVNFGCSPYFLKYPGTISLRTATLLDLIEDIIRSVYQNGFRRILVLNGHGGNDSARMRLYEVLNSLPEMRLSWYSWWTANSVVQVAQKYDLKPAHANWLEAFPFTKVAELPVQEKIPPRIAGLMNSEDTRKSYQDGSFGGPYEVGEQIGDESFLGSTSGYFTTLKIRIAKVNND